MLREPPKTFFLGVRVRVMTIPTAAEIIGTRPNRIRALVHSGALPAVAFGRLYMVRESDILRLKRRSQGDAIN